MSKDIKPITYMEYINNLCINDSKSSRISYIEYIDNLIKVMIKRINDDMNRVKDNNIEERLIECSNSYSRCLSTCIRCVMPYNYNDISILEQLSLYNCYVSCISEKFGSLYTYINEVYNNRGSGVCYNKYFCSKVAFQCELIFNELLKVLRRDFIK